MNATEPDRFETLQVFWQGLKMCMKLAVILRLFFSYFFYSKDLVIVWA